MEHIAIDLGGRESQVCVRGSDGRIVEELRVSTAGIGGYLKTRSAGRVVVETCSEAFRVADVALALGHEVRVVPATLVKSLGVGARGIKTDRRDARVLSEVSSRIDLPSVHVPSQQARGHKAMCGMREAMVGSRTQLINTVRGWMRGQGMQVRGSRAETFAARVREQAEKDKRTLPSYVLRQLEALDALSPSIGQADKEVAASAKANEVSRRLMTVPGVGPVTSLRFAAALDDIGRFATAHAVESYLGLTPGERSSSDSQRRTGITKAGAPKVRWCLVQAAWRARKLQPNDPMVRWSVEVERRRGKAAAVLALVRKMAGILYAIWRDGTVYEPARGARPTPSDTSSKEDEAAALALLWVGAMKS
jgi:transposase